MKKRISRIMSVLLIVAMVAAMIPALSRPVHAATTNQLNMVARADYMYDTTWVCQQTVEGWSGTFYAGNTYHIPYGQPIYSGKYIGFGATVEEFLEAAATPGSIFYTGRSYYTGTTAPYYVSDCSAFVSWCWGISRTTTYYIPGISTKIGSVTTYNCTYALQLGDALNHTEHVIMVTNLQYDTTGAITQIEITEQTPPQLKRSYYTPAQLASKYSAYTIYRYYGDVPAAPDAEPLEGWQQEGTTWYFYVDGVKQTGWLNDGGTWYYLGTDGAMQTGWLNVGGTWYYLNPSSGAMQTGWLYEGGVWYYLNPSNGVAQTGWITVDGCKYYMDPSNCIMQTGWVKIDDTWYYFNPSNGIMQTGWVTVDGEVYYLGTDGVMVTGTQVIDGIAYEFSSSGALIIGTYEGGMAGDGVVYADGIDISYWEGEDFQLQPIKDAGYDYVIIRCGSTNLGEDPYFDIFYDRARAAGLDVGAYFYSYATDVEGALSDAKKCLSYIQGKKFEYPIYFDYEDSCQSELTQQESTDICLAFMDTVAASGYVAGIYSYASRFNSLDMATICAKHEAWVAHYYDETHTSMDPTYSTKYGMYQYSCETYVNGNALDVNVSYKDYPAIMKKYGLNGYTFTNDGAVSTGGVPTRPAVSADKQYFPACDAAQTELIAALNSVGMSTVTTSDQLAIAQANGFTSFAYTAEQEAYLLQLLKDGELVLPVGITFGGTPVTYLPACDSSYTTLIAALNSVGISNVTLEYQMKLAIANGYTDYAYTAEQNNALLVLLKSGKMKDPENVVLDGWQNLAGTWYYYIDGVKQTGWQKLGGAWYYFSSSGAMQTGWVLDEGKWYYMNENGTMRTGWLCENNVWYYFDGYGAMVTGTRVIDGVTHNFTSSGAWIPNEYPGGMAGDGKVYADGIDVSYWNGTDLDFQAVADAGYKFVIIRCGSTNIGKDENFEMYYQKARDAGLDVGAYFYTYATTVDAAVADAEKCLSYISGKTFEYPIYFDYEDECQLELAQSLQTQICLAFMDTLYASGYVTGLCSYAAKISTMDMATIGAKYECWIANYTYSDHTVLDPTYSTQYGMFQYYNEMYIGSMGPIDVNVSYKDYPSIMKQYGLNGYVVEVECDHPSHDQQGLCGICGETVGHGYTSSVTAPTCTAEGYTTYTCTECGYSYTANAVAATGHSYENGNCTVCGGADPDYVPTITAPTLTLSYPTLSFEDQIQYNVYFTVSDLTNVAEMGLITFDSRLTDGTIADAVDVISGYTGSDGTYVAHTGGIPAKNLGDALYFKVYAKLTDGSYIYTSVAGYNAVAYAKTILSSSSTSMDAKRLMVAMLNYGAAAQEHFGYNTDNLINSFLTDPGRALVADYDESMVDDVVAADSAKAGHFVMQSGSFTSIFPTVSFEGAFSVNYYFKTGLTPDSGLTFAYWDADTYESVDKLTTANVTGMMKMTQDGDLWTAAVEGIAAKDMDKTIYVVAIYRSGGTAYTSKVIPYSIGKYCETIAAQGNEFGAATAVYGYYAKTYFANL